MSKFGLITVGALGLALFAFGCEGDDDANDDGDNTSSSSSSSSSGSSGASGSSSSSSSSSSGSSGTSSGSSGNPACAPPADYPGADAWETAAAPGLGARGLLVNLNKAMADAETANAAGENTTDSLKGLYTPLAGATHASQTRKDTVNAAIDAFIPALGQTFDPTAVAPTAGRYGKWTFTSKGVDLRQLVEKGSFGGELYRIFADPRPVAARIDSIVAMFGASPAFNLTNAASDKPVHTAKYAADRDPNGLYASFKQNAILAKFASAQGDTCSDEATAAVSELQKIWERSLVAASVYYLHRSAPQFVKAVDATEEDGTLSRAQALHSLGEVAGFLGGLRSLTAAERIATDAQLDEVLGDLRLGADATPIDFWKGDANPETVFPAVIVKLQDIYGFTETQIATFKGSAQ